jgi:hypothetical protein
MDYMGDKSKVGSPMDIHFLVSQDEIRDVLYSQAHNYLVN